MIIVKELTTTWGTEDLPPTQKYYNQKAKP